MEIVVGITIHMSKPKANECISQFSTCDRQGGILRHTIIWVRFIFKNRFPGCISALRQCHLSPVASSQYAESVGAMICIVIIGYKIRNGRGIFHSRAIEILGYPCAGCIISLVCQIIYTVVFIGIKKVDVVGINPLVKNRGHYPFAGICPWQISIPIKNLVDSRRLTGKIHSRFNLARQLQSAQCRFFGHTLHICIGNLYDGDVAFDNQNINSL